MVGYILMTLPTSLALEGALNDFQNDFCPFGSCAAFFTQLFYHVTINMVSRAREREREREGGRARARDRVKQTNRET